jgi:hypothetical protein
VEATLARKALGPVDSDGVATRADFHFQHLRAYCERLRTALSGADASDNIDKARSICRELRSAFLELNLGVTIPFRCLEPSCMLIQLPRTTCWIDHLEVAIAARGLTRASPRAPTGAPAPALGQTTAAETTESRAQERGRGDGLTGSLLLRQTVGFVALILAYLAFFHVDVQLQIVSLPAIFP